MGTHATHSFSCEPPACSKIASAICEIAKCELLPLTGGQHLLSGLVHQSEFHLLQLESPVILKPDSESSQTKQVKQKSDCSNVTLVAAGLHTLHRCLGMPHVQIHRGIYGDLLMFVTALWSRLDINQPIRRVRCCILYCQAPLTFCTFAKLIVLVMTRLLPSSNA